MDLNHNPVHPAHPCSNALPVLESAFNRLLGKPFEWGARGPYAYDCLGLMIECHRILGRPFPDYVSITPRDQSKEALAQCRMECHARLVAEVAEVCVPISQPEPYCLVFLMLRPPCVSHLGMVMPDLMHFLHVTEDVRVGKERFDNPFWRHRVEGFYRLRDSERAIHE